MAYDFEEGSSQRIDDFPSHYDYTTTMSCSFWIRAESNPGSHQAIFVSKDRDGQNEPNARFLWTPAGGGDVYVVFYAGGGFNEWKADYSPTTGVWEHWYFEIDWTTNPDTVRFWVNGVEQTVSHNFGSNNVTPSTTATQTITLGGSAVGDGNHADGMIAEVAMWSDLVGQARATALYNDGGGIRADLAYPTNLKEYIPLRYEALNYKGGSGTLTNSPTLSSTHPFYTDAEVMGRQTWASSTSDANSFTPTLPSSIKPGELLLCVFSVDGNPTVSASDWNKLGQGSNGTDVTQAIFWKISNGNDTLTVTTSNNQQASAVTLRIRNASAVVFREFFNGSSTNSSPSDLYMSFKQSYLWIVTRSGDSTVVATAAPTNYGNLQTATAGGTSGASTNTAEYQVFTNLQEPGNFTSNTEQWVAATLAVIPRYGLPYQSAIELESEPTSTNTTSGSMTFPPGLTGGGVLFSIASCGPAGDREVSTVTFNGDSATKLAEIDDGGGGDGEHSEMWFLPNPDATTGTWQVTMVGTVDNFLVSLLPLGYVSQSTTPDAISAIQTPSEDPMDTSVTTTVGNTALVSLVNSDGFSGNVPGTGQFRLDGAFSDYYVVSYSEDLAQIGTNTHSYSNGNTDTSLIILVALAPYGVPVIPEFDNVTVGQNDGASSITVNHTVYPRPNRLLVVKVYSEANANPGNRPVTGITFNGDALTKADQEQLTSPGGEDDETEIWYLVNPDIGAYDAIVTFTGAVEGCVVAVESYYNLASTGQPNAVASTSNTSSGPAEVGLTTTVNGALLVSASQTMSSSGTLAPASGQNLTHYTQNAGQLRAAGGYEVVGNAGSYTDSWTLGGTEDWLIVIAAFVPYGAGATSQIKVIAGVAIASVKTVMGVSTASIKKIVGVSNS